MNYSKAIKLLYRVKNPQIVQHLAGNTERLERELECMSRQKLKFAISMQRYAKFNKEEMENADFLLCAYPDLQIAYLDEEPAPKGGDPLLFSVLIGQSDYAQWGQKEFSKFPVAIVGTREYIFSKNIGILRDIAARARVDRRETALRSPFPERDVHGDTWGHLEGAEGPAPERGYLRRHERVGARGPHQAH